MHLPQVSPLLAATTRRIFCLVLKLVHKIDDWINFFFSETTKHEKLERSKEIAVDVYWTACYRGHSSVLVFVKYFISFHLSPYFRILYIMEFMYIMYILQAIEYLEALFLLYCWKSCLMEKKRAFKSPQQKIL